MCKTSKCTIIEVEEIVEVGKLDPNNIRVPSIYRHRIICGENYVKSIEKLMFEKEFIHNSNSKGGSSITKSCNFIASRVALEFTDGIYANLGIGIPTLCPICIPKGMIVHLHSEISVLGTGPFSEREKENADFINASKETVSLLPGVSIVSSDEVFAMIRGSHIEITILGALQVSCRGDLAN